MRTTIKRTNFPGSLTGFKLSKSFTDSQSSGHIRMQSEIITHIRTALSFSFQHFKKPAKYKLQICQGTVQWKNYKKLAEI